MRTTRFNMKEFGTRLRKLRQACGKTQEELCEEIGVSDTHYRKIEAGTRTGSLCKRRYVGPSEPEILDPVFRIYRYRLFCGEEA